MRNDELPHAPAPASPAADAAQRANTDLARAENRARIAELCSDAQTAPHAAAHIRSVVALTMARLPADAGAATRQEAERWQRWALDASEGLVQDPLAARS